VREDKNELPWDWPILFKLIVVYRTLFSQWNRYPESVDHLEAKLSNVLNIPQDHLMLFSGATGALETFISLYSKRPDQGWI